MKKLYRPKNNRMIAGVCMGLSNYFSIDVTLIRLIMVLVIIFTGFIPGLVFYLAAWLVIPEL